MSADRDVVAALIGEHSWDMTDEIRVDGVWTWVLCCECGEMPPMAEGHQHIADGILASDWLANHVRVAVEAERERIAQAIEGAVGYRGPNSATDWGKGYNSGHQDRAVMDVRIARADGGAA